MKKLCFLSAILFFIFNLSACKGDLPDKVIEESTLPFKTMLKIEALVKNVNVSYDAAYKAYVIPVSTIPNISPQGTVDFYQNEKIICKNVSIDPQTFETPICKTVFDQEGTFLIYAVYNDNSIYYKSSKSIDYYQSVKKSKSVKILPKSKRSFIQQSDIDIDINVECPDFCAKNKIVNDGWVSVYEKHQETGELALIETCENLSVHSGKTVCHIPYNEALKNQFGREFNIQYKDDPENRSYDDAEYVNYRVSYDGQKPISAIYLINNMGQLIYSTNGGKFWLFPLAQPTDHKSNKLVSLFVNPTGDIFVKSETNQIFISSDIGETWNLIAENLYESINVYMNPEDNFVKFCHKYLNEKCNLNADINQAKDIFLTPVIYTVSNQTLSSERSIKYSSDDGRTWHNIDQNLHYDSEKVPLNTFFVRPYSGDLYTIYENSDGEQIVFSTDGGRSWDIDTVLLSTHKEATALFIDPSDEDYNKFKFFVGHKDGWVSTYDLTSQTHYEYKICMERGGLTGACQITGFSQSPYQNYWFASLYSQVHNAMSDDSGFSGTASLQYLKLNQLPFNGWKAIMTPDWNQTNFTFVPRHSIAYNSDKNILYESINMEPNGFEISNSNQIVIRKNPLLEGDDSIKMLTNYPNEYPWNSMIPNNLFYADNQALYVNFIQTRNPDSTKNSKIFITTNDGETWEPLKNQPYEGKMAACLIFVQYITSE